MVALLAEGVGRNVYGIDVKKNTYYVALLAEGVGRNCGQISLRICEDVALLAEGVGRNDTINDTVENWKSRPPRGGRG